MQSKPREMVARASERLGMPAEATAGISRVELTGSSRISVENHRGVGAFGPDCMELLTPTGAILVHGQGLTLLVMNHRELVVSGKIQRIEFPDSAMQGGR